MIDVSRGEFLEFEKLLIKWNKAINLISKKSENNIWERHIVDSLQLLNYIESSDKVIDIGSGGGFPGIILSIGGVKEVTLVECDERKVIFLRQAAKLSSNLINIVEARLSGSFKANFDVVTCRGLSSIGTILKLTNGIKKKKLLLLKGENYYKEVLDAQKEWLFNYVVHDSITSEKGKILEITNERKSNFNC